MSAARLVISTGSPGVECSTVNSAVIIFVRLAIRTRSSGSRCHSTWPVLRLNSSPDLGGWREGEVHGVELRRAEAAERHRGRRERQPGRRTASPGARWPAAMGGDARRTARFAVAADEDHAQEHRRRDDGEHAGGDERAPAAPTTAPCQRAALLGAPQSMNGGLPISGEDCAARR